MNRKRHYPTKATKFEVLRFIKDREWVTVRALMCRFGYTFEGAKTRLARLAREGLITAWVAEDSWTLTQTGERRHAYFARKAKR